MSVKHWSTSCERLLTEVRSRGFDQSIPIDPDCLIPPARLCRVLAVTRPHELITVIMDKWHCGTVRCGMFSKLLSARLCDLCCIYDGCRVKVHRADQARLTIKIKQPGQTPDHTTHQNSPIKKKHLNTEVYL